MSTPHTQTFSAFIILESRHSNWQDQYFTHYQYSSRIPNGQQIKVGDLLLIAKTKKELKTDKQIYAFCTVKNIYTFGFSETLFFLKLFSKKKVKFLIRRRLLRRLT